MRLVLRCSLSGWGLPIGPAVSHTCSFLEPGLAEWPQCVLHARDSFLLEQPGLGSGQLSPRRADVAAHVMGACHACREGVSAAVLHFGSKQLNRFKRQRESLAYIIGKVQKGSVSGG